jgi:hypothetical protein
VIFSTHDLIATMPTPRRTDRLMLTNEDGQCEIYAAGAGSKDPVFMEAEPDPWTAYVRVRLGKCLPLVVGPESLTGAVFGLHPAVVARSYHGMVHKQVNMGHTLRALNKKEDRICGCVLQAAFPEEPEGGWENWQVPASVEDAPHITLLSALFKQAHGVPDMLGKHLGGRVKMSVSMEFTYYLDEVGVHDPQSGMTYDRSEIPTSLKGYLFEDEGKRLLVRKNARRPGLVLALGGKSKRIWFSGYGYTDNPAESEAGIEHIAAQKREGMMVCGSAAAAPPIMPGMTVCWRGGEFGQGRVAAVYLDGRRSRHGVSMEAKPEDPLLDIVLPNGVVILRRASGVAKKK